jgi:hypothetical protein
MPKRIKTLHEQILKHPNYPDLSESMRWAFEMGCVGGFSWRQKENNAWSRTIWRHLYWGDSLQ